MRTPELHTVHCRPRPATAGRPQHQPRPHLPIPFPPKAEARRPLMHSMDGRVWMRCPLRLLRKLCGYSTLIAAITSTSCRAEAGQASERYYCVSAVAETQGRIRERKMWSLVRHFVCTCPTRPMRAQKTLRVFAPLNYFVTLLASRYFIVAINARASIASSSGRTRSKTCSSCRNEPGPLRRT